MSSRRRLNIAKFQHPFRMIGSFVYLLVASFKRVVRNIFPLIVFIFFLFAVFILVLWGGGFHTSLAAAYLTLGIELIGGLLLYFVLSITRMRQKRVNGIKYYDWAAKLEKTSRRFYMLTTYSFLFNTEKNIGNHVDKYAVGTCRAALDKLSMNNEYVEIKILVLDPSSEAAKQREKDVCTEEFEVPVRENIKENLRDLKKWLKRREEEGKRRVQVKVYNMLPRQSLVIFDDELSFGFFEPGKNQSESWRVEMSTNTPTGILLEDAFVNLWSDKKTISLKEYLNR